MDIGSGIAIAGVRIFAGLGFGSSDTSAEGKWFALLIAIVMTTIFYNV